MEKFIVFGNNNKSEIIRINPESPFFKITRIEIPSIMKDNRGIASYIPNFVIRCVVYDIDKGSTTDVIDGLSRYITNQTEAKIDINKILVWRVGQQEIHITYICPEEIEIVVYYTTHDKKVEIDHVLSDFDNHFKLHDNSKILFSAPFGQGKTTFLNYYFEEKVNQYEVFKLYPVNYAVSHNDDIFKYIKAEIIFQLFSKDVHFDKLEFNYLEISNNYFAQNPAQILSPLLSLLPKIGETAARIFDKIFQLGEELKKYKKSHDINDEKDAIKFIKELYEKEGSIFEDNFYTQLIRQLLEQQKNSNNKKNVLIIEDIDRMDPDHIFRIFNVFSANFDSQEFTAGFANKFGFDKVILVCDHDNIKKLFLHRYGNKSSFIGYLSKYYSKQPYEFNNSSAIEIITKQFTIVNNRNYESLIGDVMIVILNDLIFSGILTLRDLLKFLNHNIYKAIDSQTDMYSNALQVSRHNLIYYNVIAFLEFRIDEETILEMFKQCRDKVKYRKNVNYNYYTRLGLVGLTNESLLTDEIKSANFKGDAFYFKLKKQSEGVINYNYYEPIELSSRSDKKYNFNVKDFYEMLVNNTERYIERF